MYLSRHRQARKPMASRQKPKCCFPSTLVRAKVKCWTVGHSLALGNKWGNSVKETYIMMEKKAGKHPTKADQFITAYIVVGIAYFVMLIIFLNSWINYMQG